MLSPQDLARSRMENGRPKKGFAIGFMDIRPGEMAWGVFVSHKVSWFDVHWWKGRHHVCTRPRGYCVCCNDGCPTLPKGYAFVLREGQLGQQVLKLTERMVREEPALSLTPDLRGSRFKLWRPGKHEKVKTCIRIEGIFPDDGKLPLPFDLDQALCRIFGTGSERNPDTKSHDIGGES